MQSRDKELDAGTTVVVSGVPDGLLPSRRMSDKLTIHFQSRRRSDGGDVAAVRYPTTMDGVAFVTFDEAEDAERVVKKKQHIMTDIQFPEDYFLTVFPFSTDVYFYVSSATVDLSFLDGDQDSLLESLRSAHRSLRFKPLSRQKEVSIEGPFAAVRALRNDLICRARRPAAITHWEAPSSLAASRAFQEPAYSRNASKAYTLERRIAGQSPLKGRFGDRGNDLGSQGGLRKVVGEERSDGILSPFNKLNLQPAEDVRTTQSHMEHSWQRTSTLSEAVRECLKVKDPFSLNNFGPDKVSKYYDAEGRKKHSTLLDSDTFQYVDKFDQKKA